jgi:hypothetical protein
VTADIDRAGGHVVILGLVLALAVVGALVFRVVRLVANRRASRAPVPRHSSVADISEPTRSTGPAERAQDPDR